MATVVVQLGIFYSSFYYSYICFSGVYLSLIGRLVDDKKHLSTLHVLSLFHSDFSQITFHAWNNLNTPPTFNRGRICFMQGNVLFRDLHCLKKTFCFLLFILLLTPHKS